MSADPKTTSAPPVQAAQLGPVSVGPSPDKGLLCQPDDHAQSDVCERDGCEVEETDSNTLADDWDGGTDCPAWVLEGEAKYLRGELSSQGAVAQFVDRPRTTVSWWATKREWTTRRAAIKEAAAERLRKSMDSAATQDLVDSFEAIDHDTVKAGRFAARVTLTFVTQVAQDQARHVRQKKRGVYIPPAFPSSFLAIAERADALRPQTSEESEQKTALDEMAEALNPRRRGRTALALRMREEEAKRARAAGMMPPTVKVELATVASEAEIAEERPDDKGPAPELDKDRVTH